MEGNNVDQTDKGITKPSDERFLDFYFHNHHILENDIRYTKTRLWYVVFYLLAFHFGLLAIVKEVFAKPNISIYSNPYLACLFVLIYLIVTGIGIFILINYVRDLQRYRGRADAILKKYEEMKMPIIWGEKDTRIMSGIDWLFAISFIVIALLGLIFLIIFLKYI